jgi:Flp pilus assembly protein protease CpaA
MTTIPSWILSIEVMMGIVWMLFGTIFIIQWYSIWVIFTHLIFLSMVLILALEDIKSYTIPDKLSLPMIGLTLIILALSWWFYEEGLLPGLKYSLIWGVVGMLFYLLQMLLPALSTVIKKGNYEKALRVIFIPIFLPFWLVIKLFFGEKKADQLITSVSLMDNLPVWVGGGDVRLGILLGLMLWPILFWWTIGIGYTIGTLFWLISRLAGKKNLDILPVAPLLFLGFCATWIIQLFV